MTKEKFFRLARQVIVQLPDPDTVSRAKIHRHIGDVQASVYSAIEEMLCVTGRLPSIPSLHTIEEKAWELWR